MLKFDVLCRRSVYGIVYVQNVCVCVCVCVCFADEYFGYINWKKCGCAIYYKNAYL